MAAKKVIGYEYSSGNPRNVFFGLSSGFEIHNAISTTMLFLGSLEGHRSRDY